MTSQTSTICAARFVKDRGASVGDEIGGKAVDKFQNAFALKEQRVSVVPYHAHVGASCEGFATTTG